VLNNIIKVAALAAFIVCISFLPVFVPLPDLIVVVVIVAVMATFDFLVYPVLRRKKQL
jgi:hypothetical protein